MIETSALINKILLNINIIIKEAHSKENYNIIYLFEENIPGHVLQSILSIMRYNQFNVEVFSDLYNAKLMVSWSRCNPLYQGQTLRFYVHILTQLVQIDNAIKRSYINGLNLVSYIFHSDTSDFYGKKYTRGYIENLVRIIENCIRCKGYTVISEVSNGNHELIITW